MKIWVTNADQHSPLPRLPHSEKGEPMPTEAFTVEQLKAAGILGEYVDSEILARSYMILHRFHKEISPMFFAGKHSCHSCSPPCGKEPCAAEPNFLIIEPPKFVMLSKIEELK